MTCIYNHTFIFGEMFKFLFLLYIYLPSSIRNSLIFHSDYVRKELLSISPYKKELASYNEGIYASQATEKTYAEMIKRAKNALKRGQNVILDATYREKKKRETVQSEVAKLGIEPIFVETICKEKEIKERLKKREKER